MELIWFNGYIYNLAGTKKNPIQILYIEEGTTFLIKERFPFIRDRQKLHPLNVTKIMY